MDHIGIDVHKRESQIYILAEGGEVVEQRIRTEPERFAAVLGTRPRARILIEASTDSEWVARCLEALGHEGGEAFLEDRDLALPETGHLLGVEVRGDDVVPEAGQARRRGEADVSRPDDRDATHGRLRSRIPPMLRPRRGVNGTSRPDPCPCSSWSGPWYCPNRPRRSRSASKRRPV